MNELEKANVRLRVFDIVASCFEGEAKDVVEKCDPIAEWVLNGRKYDAPKISSADVIVD